MNGEKKRICAAGIVEENHLFTCERMSGRNGVHAVFVFTPRTVGGDSKAAEVKLRLSNSFVNGASWRLGLSGGGVERTGESEWWREGEAGRPPQDNSPDVGSFRDTGNA